MKQKISKKIEIDREKYRNLNKILQIIDKEFSEWINEIIDKYLLLIEVKDDDNKKKTEDDI